jgi:hypothetical protein
LLQQGGFGLIALGFLHGILLAVLMESQNLLHVSGFIIHERSAWNNVGF